LPTRLLDTTDLFAALPADVVSGLQEQATTRRYARNEVVFHQGEGADELFVIDRGRIAIAQRSSDGRESVVAVLEAGEMFGEMALFDEEPVRAVLRAQPGLLWVVVRLLSLRLRATDEALADAVFLDVPARTAKRLLDLSSGRDRFSLPITQEELAGMVGASRERVNKAISLFTRLGWVSLEGRNQYRILDRQALEERAAL